MQMNQPAPSNPLDDNRHGQIGRAADRVDGRLKVTGSAPYAYEVGESEAPAYGFVVSADISCGRIARIDSSEAEQCTGRAAGVDASATPPSKPHSRKRVTTGLPGPLPCLVDDQVRIITVSRWRSSSRPASSRHVLLRGCCGSATKPEAGVLIGSTTNSTMPSSLNQQTAFRPTAQPAASKSNFGKAAGAARPDLSHADPDPCADGTACQSGLVGRRSTRGALFDPVHRKRAETCGRHTDAR